MMVALVCTAIGWMCWSVGNTCNAQTPPSSLSPDLQEVVKLSQQKMSDDVITNYIRNSGKSYNLSADDIIHLSSQGVSQGVISALQTAPSANPNPPPGASFPTTPVPPPPPPSPPPATPASPAPSSIPPGPVPPPAMIAPSAPVAPAAGPPVSLELLSRTTRALRRLGGSSRLWSVLASNQGYCSHSRRRLASLL